MKHSIYKSRTFLFYFLVRCFTLCVGLMCFVNTSTAQEVKLYYDLKKDRGWIEKQEKVIKSFEDNWDDKKYPIKLLSYFNNCYKLGKYYEDMFDRKKTTIMDKAILYYDLIIQ
jgi:hypothetical protein